MLVTGWRDDVRDLLAVMDVFVLASWREGMPRSAIEAAAMGRPLVLTDIRGCREVARHEREALLVPPRDPEALAALLRTRQVSSQALVLEHLRGQGFDATQATISRDLDDLGAVKVRGPDGRLVYALPEAGNGHDATDSDLLRATFPPGSVTGAPKVRAMQIIGEQEATGREIYTGAIGYAGPRGLETSVVIRTFEIRGDRVWLGVGGGVVADSDPDAELDECFTKAAPLLRAVGARLETPAPVGAVRASRAPTGRPAVLTRLAGPGRPGRPDAAAGIFDTLLVRGSYGTAFRARWLNEAAFRLISFIYISPPVFFRFFHAAHHTYTQIRGKDPDIVLPSPASWGDYLYYVSSIPLWLRNAGW